MLGWGGVGGGGETWNDSELVTYKYPLDIQDAQMAIFREIGPTACGSNISGLMFVIALAALKGQNVNR